jgi:molybdate transport system substrate-binding protein
MTSLDKKAQAGELKVFSVGGVKSVMMKLGDDFQSATGERVQFTFGAIGKLQEKMEAGELPDVLIATSQAIDKAEQQGTIVPGSSMEVGRTGVGVAVREGAPAPDISTPNALRQALLNAKSLAYSDPKTGAASGVATAKVLAHLGIADQVRDKSVFSTKGPVGELVAQGQVELGIQQITELLPVKGITLVGPLPPELQTVTVYRAAVLTGTAKPEISANFIRFITSPKVAPMFLAAGFGRQ